jgi:hypothetical protein
MAGPAIDDFVLLRTQSGNVHCGYMVEAAGMAVVLGASRNVWRWRGANSFNELALHGAAEEYTRISEPVDEVLFTDVIQVTKCTPKAQENLSRSRWGG